jgi:hypothetical protein
MQDVMTATLRRYAPGATATLMVRAARQIAAEHALQAAATAEAELLAREDEAHKL